MEEKIQISVKLTWLNILVSCSGGFGFCYWFLDLMDRASHSNIFIHFYIMFVSVMLVILIQTLDTCNICCCNACIINCYPVTKITSLDPTKMEEPIHREDIIGDQEIISLRDIRIANCDVLF